MVRPQNLFFFVERCTVLFLNIIRSVLRCTLLLGDDFSEPRLHIKEVHKNTESVLRKKSDINFSNVALLLVM
jgi:hypothetical protein